MDFSGCPPSRGDSRGLDKVVRRTNRFSLRLFKRVSSLDSRSTVCLCPFAVFHALLMTYASAQGNTKLQMAKAFKVNKKYDLHSGFQALLHALHQEKPEVRQELACHVFVERSFPLVPAYESVLSDKHLAEVHLVEMSNAPEQVRSFVNSTVERTTGGNICQLLVSGVADQDSKILFFNSLTYKANWEKPFPSRKAVTEKHPFTLMRGAERTAELVCISGFYRHHRDADMKVLVVEVPFKSGHLSMVLFLGDSAGSLKRFHKHLSVELYEKLLDQLSYDENITVNVPMLKLEETVQPSYTLQHMGFVDLFDEHADLGGAGKGLFVSDVMQKVTLTIDTTGMSASAAVSVALTDYYTEELPKAYRDVASTRPFIYVIKHQETGVILFMGAVQDL